MCGGGIATMIATARLPLNGESLREEGANVVNPGVFEEFNKYQGATE